MCFPPPISQPSVPPSGYAPRSAVRARSAVAALVAVSGGRTPWRMFRDLRRLRVHWHDLQVFQVDERVVPEGDERRNTRQIAHSARRTRDAAPQLPTEIRSPH
jgi:6-phosphogluconolactonase/glucosamine-6-phosphate isomerase/deaminase